MSWFCGMCTETQYERKSLKENSVPSVFNWTDEEKPSTHERRQRAARRLAFAAQTPSITSPHSSVGMYEEV